MDAKDNPEGIFQSFPSELKESEVREIGPWITQISILLNRQMREEENTVTAVHGRILGYLGKCEKEEIFQRDLEEEFSVRRATISKILSLMEKNGLIERKPVPYDARLKKLELTEKGWRARAEKSLQIEKIEIEMASGIPKEKLDVFFEVCDMIKNNLCEMEDKK